MDENMKCSKDCTNHVYSNKHIYYLFLISCWARSVPPLYGLLNCSFHFSRMLEQILPLFTSHSRKTIIHTHHTFPTGYAHNSLSDSFVKNYRHISLWRKPRHAIAVCGKREILLVPLM